MPIRIAAHSDKPYIIAIMNQAIEERRNAHILPFVKEEADAWFSKLFEYATQLVVVEHEKDVVAWGSLTPYRSGRGALSTTIEATFYVHKSHRGKGVGTSVLDHLIKEAKELGFNHLVAILLDDNHPSIRLLKRHGFSLWANFEGIVHFPEGIKGHMYMGKHL